MLTSIAAKALLVAGSVVATGAAVATGYHHGIMIALDHVPEWTHAHEVLSGLMDKAKP